MKTENKEKLTERLESALRDLYHNATPAYPYDLMERFDQLTGKEGAAYEEFNDMAFWEVEYLNDGGSYGRTPYGNMAHNSGKTLTYKWIKNRQYYRERAEFPAYRICEYGNLYTYGRGGRTLAPDELVDSRGCGFRIKRADDFSEWSRESLTELILILEAFNLYVANWNSRENLSWLFKEKIRELEGDIQAEISKGRKTLISLVQDIRNRRKVNTPAESPVCSVLRREVKNLLESIREKQARLA